MACCVQRWARTCLCAARSTPPPKELVIRAPSLVLDEYYLANVQLLCKSIEILTIMLEQLPGGVVAQAGQIKARTGGTHPW